MTSANVQSLDGRIAVVTGASSGIGEATAVALASRGATVVLGARRLERLESLRDRLAKVSSADAIAVDVSDADSSRRFVDRVLSQRATVDILINNAGLARGLADVVDSEESDWREMVEANVMGLMRMTRLILPTMIEKKSGDIVHVGSVAGLEPYPKGAAYCASKAAVEAFAKALRVELLGTNIREMVIEPGMVDTEFSDVRFHGDGERARKVYQGLAPLSAQDVAECIAFALTLPPHVSIHTLHVMPTAQASATRVHRELD